MAKFTYLPGPGDYTLMLLDPYSSFAVLNWEHIGWEEAVRRANLFCAAPDLLYACKETLGEMRAYCAEQEDDETSPMKPTFDQLKAAIAKAEGKGVEDV
jgi:hypothetical protein